MFIRAKVIEVISHPYILNQNVIRSLIERNEFKLTNVQSENLLKDLPRNSIIAQIIGDNTRVIALPFFSSHIGFPLKPDESVWLFREENEKLQGDSKNIIEYFWLSRIHGMNFYEDLNYTHDDRKYLKKYTDRRDGKLSLKNEVFALDKGIIFSNTIPTPQFNQGPQFDTINGKSNILSDNVNIKKLNITGKYLIEDVPRYTKNPGDFIIQGSNNTLIKLGTNNAHNSNNNLFINKRSIVYSNDIEKQSGTIDIVAGRAAMSKEYLTKNQLKNYSLNGQNFSNDNISTKAYRNGYLSILNERNTYENIKDTEYYLGEYSDNIAEGEPDFFTDISRLYISEKCDGDDLLNINNLTTVSNDVFSTKNIMNSTTNRGFIIAKSDEIRLVAREKVFNLSGNFSSNTPYQSSGGSIRLIKEGDENNSSSIVLDELGFVLINGKKIIIGEESFALENGKSEHIYLGQGAKEPLVLGYLLKNKLENFMNEVSKSLILISKNLDEINTKFNQHTHQYAGAAGITSPTTDLVTNLFTPSESTNMELVSNIEGEVGNFEGKYGIIPNIEPNPSTIKQSIENIEKIKTSLVEILSTLGRTL